MKSKEKISDHISYCLLCVFFPEIFALSKSLTVELGLNQSYFPLTPASFQCDHVYVSIPHLIYGICRSSAMFLSQSTVVGNTNYSLW